MLSLKSFVIMLCGVCLAALSQLLLKSSANRKHDGFIRQYLNARVIAAYGMLFVSMLLAVWAYTGMDMKYGPAIESVGLVLVTLLSWLLLGERISRRKVLGCLLIVAGLIVFVL